MATEFTPISSTEILDLTGLPEPVIQGIKQIVETLRRSPLGRESPTASARAPLKGRFANLNLSIPKEHIDAAQQEAWSGFPREFPEPTKGP